MKFDDLKVEPIKTIMATQRILLTRFGYAISFMGDDNTLMYGDGINTFEIRVYKHKLDLDKDIDFFDKTIDPGVIDFKNVIFEMHDVPRSEVDDFFTAFIL